MADLYRWEQYEPESKLSSYQSATGRYHYVFKFANGWFPNEQFTFSGTPAEFEAYKKTTHPDAQAAGFIVVKQTPIYETKYTTTYSKGRLIATFKAEYNVYVHNARNSNGY